MRTVNLSVKLKDAANTEKPQLSFQRRAVQDFHSRQADKNDPPPSTVGTKSTDPNAPFSASTVPTPQNTYSIVDSDSDDEGGIIGHPQAKRRRAVTVNDVDMTDAEGDMRNNGMVFNVSSQ